MRSQFTIKNKTLIAVLIIIGLTLSAHAVPTVILHSSNVGIQSINVRCLAHGLNPVSMEKGSLGCALQAFVEEVTRTFNVACRLEDDQSWQGLDQTMATHLYRIAQEAICSIRHGKANHISIRLHGDVDRICLKVDADGTGILKTSKNDDGMGMWNMKQRASVIGGVLDIQSRPGSGTWVRCVCPRTPQKEAGI